MVTSGVLGVLSGCGRGWSDGYSDGAYAVDFGFDWMSVIRHAACCAADFGGGALQASISQAYAAVLGSILRIMRVEAQHLT